MVRIARVQTSQGVRVAFLDGGRLLLGRTGSMREVVEELGTIGDQHVGLVLTRQTIRFRDSLLRAPLDDPGKIVGIGQNYLDHVAEQGLAAPSEPVVFAKFGSAIVGPGETIRWSRRVTAAVDFEAELAVVIGRRARSVSESEALSYVFGYTCLNDVSARDLQFSDGQWVRGKSLDTFCPIGPWIVTAEEIPDPQALGIRCTVSGEVLQEATTADMIFSVRVLIARLSRSFTLEPGDLVATGTPPGCGWFRSPKRLLRDGDSVTVSISGIGELKNSVAVDA